MNRAAKPFRVASLCTVAAALLGAGGCERTQREDSGHGGTSIEIVDALGDTLRLKTAPHRVVSLAPSITEMVFALGAERRLVGATDFCDYPPVAREIPRVAGFNVINLEAIVAAKPELVLASRGNLPEDLAAIRQMGIPVFAFEIESLPALVSGIETLGALLSAEARADSLSASWRARIDDVRSHARVFDDASRPRVFFGGLAEPIFSVGPGSFADDLISTAGGRNVFADLPNPWPRIDLETLVSRDPDVLILGFMAAADTVGVLERLRKTPGWRNLSAVQRGRIGVMGDEALRPGPRLLDALEAISDILVAYGAKP